jgi:hypothetical protein
MSKTTIIVLLSFALVWLTLKANWKFQQMQLRVIEAQCERAVAIELTTKAWPNGKVCEIKSTDIWIHVEVSAGRYKFMECDEPIWPFKDVTESCKFGP